MHESRAKMLFTATCAAKKREKKLWEGRRGGVCLSQGSWNQKVFNVTATQLFAYGGQKNVAKICKHVPRGASQPVVGFLHNLCLFMWSRSLEPTATETADRRLTTSHNP